MNDLVSIIMPSYNTAEFISETIQSVISQTHENWELIIIDDCSTDNSDSVVSNIYDPRIKFLKNETNSGAAFSRNRALQEANGDWIAFLDSDDIWHPDKLKKQLRFMKENSCHFSYTKYEEMNVSGELTGVVVSGPKKISKVGMYNFCWPGCLTVMYDRNYVGLIQIANIKKNNDYAMWLKICHRAKCYLLPEVLACYRRGRQGSISTHSIKTMIGWHYKLFHEAENQNAIRAAFNTVRNLCFGFVKKMVYVRKR